MKTEMSCFVIMPITVTEPIADMYRDKEKHFAHVLDCLIKPAVEKAGFTAIPPIAKGADLIHAGIIDRLETADLVLCDMSTLNPNVFFELGIRVSLNKPVCLMKDELLAKVPFDTGIVNYHEYASSLESWEISGEIDKLSSHIKESYGRSEGENSLWKYFGLKSEATPSDGILSDDDKWQILSNKIDSLETKLALEGQKEYRLTDSSDREDTTRLVFDPLNGVGVDGRRVSLIGSELDIEADGLTPAKADEVKKWVRRCD